jgi:hypothetical protein
VCFVISSVIHFNPQPLSYVGTRSLYSPEERAVQTLASIESIRRYYPDAHIALAEMGNRRDLPLQLESAVDQYIYLSSPLVRWACNSPYKGLGEAVGLYAASRQLAGKGDYFFKLSGRYFLTESFVPSAWDHDKFVAYKYSERLKHMSTKLYGFSGRLFPVWQRALSRTRFLMIGKRKELEYFFPKFLPADEMHLLPRLGVGGQLGPYGTFVEE